jgi:hypothetical protein
MEWLLKWLDDIDDLLVVFRVQGPAAVATLLLVAGFAASVGAILLLGQPPLLAAP